MKKIFLLIICLQELCRSSPLIRPTLLTYSIPEDRSLKRRLGFNEDTYLNFTELTGKYNYPAEEHTVTTEDGYILTVFRILPRCNRKRTEMPVLLMHGLFDSSDMWILSGPRSGLAYILAENCYDVWVANNRGNRYSRKHISWDPNKDIEYWNFSFDENGYFDVPAIIDHIINITSVMKIFYIGHSEGTTDFYIAMSLRPDYNSKIQLSIHLAPVAWFKHFRSPILKALSQISPELKFFLDSLGVGELFARGQLSQIIAEFICQFAPQEFCGTSLALTTGFLKNTISSRTLAVAFGHLLAGVSSKTLAHFGQLILAKRFQRYDEGRIGNIKRYGTDLPPMYNVTNIISPVLLICGQNDWVSTINDVNELSSRLRNAETYIVPNTYWSHNNHVWDNDAPELVFKRYWNTLNVTGLSAFKVTFVRGILKVGMIKTKE